VKSSEGEEEGDSNSVGNRTRSTVSVNSVYSRMGYGSEKSLGEASGGSGLSIREVEKIKRWVRDKKREEKKCNIIIRGIKMPKETEKDWKRGREWATEFIKENLRVECKPVSCRESGAVVVVKLETDEIKREIMRNKYILKGGKIFIENDLSWEERKTQGEINKWAKVQKEKGIDVKIGIGRVRVKGIWRYWTEILNGKEKRKMIGKGREGEGKGGEKDMGEEKKRKRRIGVVEEEREDGGREREGEKGTEKNLE